MENGYLEEMLWLFGDYYYYLKGQLQLRCNYMYGWSYYWGPLIGIEGEGDELNYHLKNKKKNIANIYRGSEL